MKKSVKVSPKTTVETTELRVQPHGGALRNGGTNKGGPGRPPKAFKDFLAELRQNPKVQEALEKAATDHEARNFKAALDVIVRYDNDVPAEKVNHKHMISDEQREARLMDLVVQAKRRKDCGELVS